MPPAILYYAIPGFVLLLSIEAWASYRENRHLYEKRDTLSSLSLGIGNVVVGFATKAMIFGLFFSCTSTGFSICNTPFGGTGFCSFLWMIFHITGFTARHTTLTGFGLRMWCTIRHSITTWRRHCGKPGRATQRVHSCFGPGCRWLAFTRSGFFSCNSVVLFTSSGFTRSG